MRGRPASVDVGAFFRVLVIVSTSCTFPDVDIDPPVESPPDGGVDRCSAPDCVTDARACATAQRDARTQCEQRSCGGLSCEACDVPYDGDIRTCVESCLRCAEAAGCSELSAAATCRIAVSEPIVGARGP